MDKDSRPLVKRDEIRLAMLGITPGNGHPFSWSAIFNGYDEAAMAGCPYPTIPDYLGKEPKQTLRIPGVRVTHVCCTGRGEFEAEQVARASLIPHVVKDPLEVIGQVDAVVIATDIGGEHVERARPFVEAGLPVFVDKPLADNAADLAVFSRWAAEGKPIMSSSCMRYAKEYMPYRLSTNNLGALRYLGVTMAKKWETYGIHALEAVYPIAGPGFLTARNTGTAERNVVHFRHGKGFDVTVVTTCDMAASGITLCGTRGSDQVASKDSYYMFRKQLESFIDYLRTGVRPYPFSETEELMRMVIAGILSRERGGAEIALADIR